MIIIRVIGPVGLGVLQGRMLFDSSLWISAGPRTVSDDWWPLPPGCSWSSGWREARVLSCNPRQAGTHHRGGVQAKCSLGEIISTWGFTEEVAFREVFEGEEVAFGPQR